MIPSETTNSVVLITTESFVIKRCQQLIDQMEETAKKQQGSAVQEPATTAEETLNLEQLDQLRSFSVDDLSEQEPSDDEESKKTLESTGNIIAQIIEEMGNSSATPEILSASNDKRVNNNFTRHSYAAQFANSSIGNHLVFIEKIRTRAPHLVFELLEIKNNAKKNSRDKNLHSLRLRLVSFSSLKSENKSK